MSRRGRKTGGTPTETREPDYQRATILANRLTRWVEDVKTCAASAPEPMRVRDEDALLALTMAMVYLAHQMRATVPSIMGMVRTCLEGQIMHLRRGVKTESDLPS